MSVVVTLSDGPSRVRNGAEFEYAVTCRAAVSSGCGSALGPQTLPGVRGKHVSGERHGM
jgi:hypothetical protein